MSPLSKNLNAAISDVLEKMFFLLPDEERPQDRELENRLAMHIGITGTPGYVITLEMEREFASALGADFLGIDADQIDEGLPVKCLQETANIVAGRFLLQFAPGGNRDVTLPDIRKEAILKSGTIVKESMDVLRFNGYPVAVRLETVESLA